MSTSSAVPALLCLLLLALPACGGDGHERLDPAGSEEGGVAASEEVAVINGRRLGTDAQELFRELYGVVPSGGEFWYDANSGLWGPAGGSAQGFLLPGLDLGPLAADASNGDSAVVVNGRRLPQSEVLEWQVLLNVPVVPGRYWLQHDGSYGAEGNPFPAGNLLLLIAQRERARGFTTGGGGPWSTRFGAGNYDPGSGAGYVSVPGHGPIGFGM